MRRVTRRRMRRRARRRMRRVTRRRATMIPVVTISMVPLDLKVAKPGLKDNEEDEEEDNAKGDEEAVNNRTHLSFINPIPLLIQSDHVIYYIVL
jgi:hypothetical protein